MIFPVHEGIIAVKKNGTAKRRIIHGCLMKEMGLKSYRFSVNWCRIVPEPGKKNPRGIAFYKNLVKEIRAAGMEPLVTLYHWDLPLWAHKKGGWKNPMIDKEGYGPRFGLIHVDYQTQKRTIKDSGRFYADVIRTNGENLK
ncbi:MAG: family 1 glycosylhydrolase [Lachnospiraceae bacterium]|nr:family 1 glycosylhydrolase [Lachnospiraceae bacterium]